MEAKFTRGPWRLEPNTRTYGEIACMWSIPESLEPQGWIHIVTDEPFALPHGEEQAANARLIAAAPDIYEALELLSRLLDGEASSTEEAWRIAGDKTRAALAKAVAS